LIGSSFALVLLPPNKPKPNKPPDFYGFGGYTSGYYFFSSFLASSSAKIYY